MLGDGQSRTTLQHRRAAQARGWLRESVEGTILEPATHFFADLHQRIAQGSAPLTAFRRAQLATRAVFPVYRDWGAFVFLNGWHYTAQEAT
ncbi:hypothetical protein IQ64_15475 [Streptomyces stelliscabiei]|nr:hypothetical protein IQ64_15475 [Streptomyces stelliscabiei]